MRDGSSIRLVPARLAEWMQPFSEGFTAPTWRRVLVLIVGTILTPGRRTVAAALRVVGLEQTADVTNYHRVLNRSRWSSRWVARCLFRVLVNSFAPTGPVVIGLEDTIERRWGAKIKARGIARSSWLVLCDHVVGQRSLHHSRIHAANRELVSEAVAYVQRCTGHGPSRTVGTMQFRNIEAAARYCQILRKCPQEVDKRRLLCRLNGQSPAKCPRQR
jgi:DDE superfamily endonuclease